MKAFDHVSTEEYLTWVDKAMLESAFQARIFNLAINQSPIPWKVYHAKKMTTYRPGGKSALTAVTSKGFPDLLIAAPGRTIYAELKKEDNYPEPDQREWLDLLASNDANEVYLWKPRHWDYIVEGLVNGVYWHQFLQSEIARQGKMLSPERITGLWKVKD